MRRGGCSVAQPGWLPTWPVQQADAAPSAGLSRGFAWRMSALGLGRVDFDAPQSNFPYAVLQRRQCLAQARCSDGVVLCTVGVGTFGGAVAPSAADRPEAHKRVATPRPSESRSLDPPPLQLHPPVVITVRNSGAPPTRQAMLPPPPPLDALCHGGAPSGRAGMLAGMAPSR